MGFDKRNPFDIHFYFTKENEKSALEVREKLRKEFDFLTFYDPHPNGIGPHLCGMWEADFKNSKNQNEDFGKVLAWLMLNRNGHSVLVHPHTGNSLKDHTDHAIWLGDKLKLKLEVLKD